MFDNYDMAGAVPTLVDVSAVWCGPCNGISSWLAGTGDDYGFSSLNPDLPDMIASGAVQWITILGENSSGAELVEGQISAWDERYPNEMVPVLGGEGSKEIAYDLLAGGWPTVILLNADFTIATVPGSPSDVSYYQAILDSAEL